MHDNETTINVEKEKILRKKTLKEFNGIDCSVENKKLKELENKEEQIVVNKGLELLANIKTQFPDAEKYFFESIKEYITNEPELPYAKIIYYLTSLIELAEQYNSEDSFILLGNLASHTMMVLQDYVDSRNIKINYDEVDFKYVQQHLSNKEAAEKYVKTAKKILQVIDLDTQEKVKQFSLLNLEFVNISMNCVELV